MTPAEILASPSDITAIVTSLGVFSLAVAAVVGGIYKGIQQIKKGKPSDGESEVKSAVLIETVTLQELSESNRLSAEATMRLVSAVNSLETAIADMSHDLKENRQSIRGTSSAMGDLCEVIRSLILRIRSLESRTFTDG